MGSIATSVIANEVEKMVGKDVFKYSLKRGENIKTLQTKTYAKLSSKVKLLLLLTYYFKG